MRVLLTNDDGIDAPGIRALEAAIDDDAEVTVVAPHRGYSGCGHQVTVGEAIRVERVAVNRFKVFGTPADCARLGIAEIAPEVEWVLSGVNAGANLGVDLVMSGTVAAIREAAWLGKRGIAFSQYVRRDAERDWERTQAMTRRILRQLWNAPMDAGMFWNVNFPDNEDDVQSVAVMDTFPEPKHLDVTYRVNDDLYLFGGDYRKRPRTKGSDVDVCFGGAISVSCVSGMS